MCYNGVVPCTLRDSTNILALSSPKHAAFAILCSAARYGELCPLLAKVYYTYGHALLRIAESKADALGGPAAAEEEEEDDEDGAGGVSESKTGEGGEEDIAAEEGEDADDVQVAFENRDVARVIYSRMEPTKVSISSGPCLRCCHIHSQPSLCLIAMLQSPSPTSADQRGGAGEGAPAPGRRRQRGRALRRRAGGVQNGAAAVHKAHGAARPVRVTD